ncbi:MAG: glycosyltransferase family 39 protein [Candidatus Saccharicenans sp.]
MITIRSHKAYKIGVYLLAFFVFIGTNLFSTLIFDRSPHIHDEAGYDFQAKIFLLGRLFVPSSCAKELFDFPHVINNGRWYSQYSPGFPALLAIGHLFRAQWIVNPFFASFLIILLFCLGKEIFDERTGFLAALIASLSCWFITLSSTLMSHTSHLFFCTLFLLFFIRFTKTPNLKNGIIAGTGIFMAFLIRPYESILFAIAPAIYLLFKLIKEPKKYFKNSLIISLMALGAAVILMLYNYGTTGHPLKMGYIERYGADHGLGFGKTGYLGVPHTFLRGCNYIWANIVQLHLHLFGWPGSSFLGIILFLVFYFRRVFRHQSQAEETLLIFILLTTAIGFLPY